MTKENQLIYLNINNTSEGLKVFGCGTRFDYYLLKISNNYIKTIIIDEDNYRNEIDLKNIPFIPNKNINLISKLISINIEDNIEVLKPGGDPRRDYISDLQDETYKYVMIHSTPLSGIRYKYSSIEKKSDHFGIKKIIFGDSGLNNVIIDVDGSFGATCHSISLKFESLSNAEKIKKALLSNEFKIFLKACSWSNYQIDWRLFTYLKKDFWKEFI
jgi:hypothetical protein